MSCRCGSTFLTPILAIAGLVAAGAAGYRVLSGGCGSCEDATVNAALVAGAADDKGECGLCPGHSECESHIVTTTAEKADGCCASKAAVQTVAAEAKSECCMAKEAANVKTVAATETKKEGCCSEGKTEAATEKVCKEGKDGCTGDGKEGCCGGCEGQKSEEKKADGAVATSGK